ncbi:hypothetical protein Cgig2_007700 [Carnegiea gigantea]|uniref:Uncharacterized protein n=1 Tax=Carnegiea gigantea TaxID=171969 RepID=A0A9Q1QFR1_9CARY|nr:hypothetical protein Cgig2_007700 [Carnegiea gigantea]
MGDKRVDGILVEGHVEMTNICENSKKQSLNNRTGNVVPSAEDRNVIQDHHFIHVLEDRERRHYENFLNEKITPDIKQAEAKYQELEHKRKESYEKASYICPESELEALGGYEDSSPEQLSAQLMRMNQRLQRAREKYTESIDDLRMLYEKKQRKILKKQKTYENFRQQLQFLPNASFNGHLGKKGISGKIKVSYEEKTLLIEVKMPQDASSTAVQDTRGLSVFLTPLNRLFQDAVSRKISLDTLVDFALSQGSQWIFITPHDISKGQNARDMLQARTLLALIKGFLEANYPTFGGFGRE